jgi:hypothetical protein
MRIESEAATGGGTASDGGAMPEAGRMCPRDYRYPPAVLNRPPDLSAGTLYVVGGLYGNLAALDTIEAMAAAEPAPVTIVLNGDFHWFDAAPDWFAEIERRTSPYPALRGNIETEVARADDIGAGCGCVYPASVSDAVVTRSNQILGDLRRAAATQAATRLAGLPMHLVAQVGALRVGIVHGDAESLGGWRFAHDELDDEDALPWLDGIRRTTQVDLFASTHTCLAAHRSFDLTAGRLDVINNGSAGMANFAGTQYGVISRIGTTPCPHPRLYGAVQDEVFVDALAVDFDMTAFLDRFVARWPEGSAAHASYFRRIMSGPEHTVRRACS